MSHKIIRSVLMFIFGGLSLAMIVIVVLTSLQSNLAEVIPQIKDEPWFMTTIIDFYFNVIVISLWVFYKENNWVKSLLWTVSFVLLGSITTCLYVFIQLCVLNSEEPWYRIFIRRVEG